MGAKLNPIFKVTHEELQFANNLAVLTIKAGELGLYKTMRSLNQACFDAGFEVAGKREERK